MLIILPNQSGMLHFSTLNVMRPFDLILVNAGMPVTSLDSLSAELYPICNN
jgi:hypothetical protein